MQNIKQNFNTKLWTKLRSILSKYTTKNGQIPIYQLERICKEVLNYKDQNEIDYVIKNSWRVDTNENDSISLQEMGNFLFKNHCAQISLSRMHYKKLICHGSSKKIRSDEFYQLLSNGVAFLDVKLDPQNCKKIFKQIDKDQDEFITYEEYFLFVRNNVCQKYKDDDNHDDNLDEIYEDYWALSKKVRRTTKQFLSKYERIGHYTDQKLSESEIKKVLTNLLKYDGCQLDGVFKIAMKYDLNGDKQLSFDEFTTFIVQQHFGGYAIKRLLKAKAYEKGNLSQGYMNKLQFVKTLNDGLRAINLSVTPHQISRFYSQITKYKSGWIRFTDYLDFLRRYFGTIVYKKYNEVKYSNWELSTLARKKMKQILIAFDRNKDLKFSKCQMRQALVQLLNQSQAQLQEAITNEFRYDKDQNKVITYDELVNFCLQQHFGYIVLSRFNRDKKYQKGDLRLINQDQFILTVSTFLNYIKVKPKPGQLQTLFKETDIQKQGWIYYEQYFLFVRTYFGSQSSIIPDPHPKEDEVEGYIRNILQQLKAYFRKYDSCSKGYLNYSDLQKFTKQILHNTCRQVRELFWNKRKFDNNYDLRVNFFEFAQFVITHSGQIALQRYHRDNQKHTYTLTQTQLFIVLSDCFSFLKTVPRSQSITNIIYDRMGGGCDPKYTDYFRWLNRLVARIKK